MPIKLNGATSGSVELDVPAAVGSDLQLTLPATAGTALVAPGTTSITVPSVNGTLDRLERSGNILQAVQYARAGTSGSASSILSSTTTSFATFLTKDITTTQDNSKILIMSNWVMYSGTRGRYRLLRNSTEIGYDPYARYSTGTNDMDNYKIAFIDSPSQTSGTTITYSVQGANANGSADTLFFGYGDSGGGSDATLILVEIAP
jgi:hypothetical protein|tara:strand:- start:234 stop:845 length:612 start_codon:yes stop_codon:yes gene_type:complete